MSNSFEGNVIYERYEQVIVVTIRFVSDSVFTFVRLIVRATKGN